MLHSHEELSAQGPTQEDTCARRPTSKRSCWSSGNVNEQQQQTQPQGLSLHHADVPNEIPKAAQNMSTQEALAIQIDCNWLFTKATKPSSVFFVYSHVRGILVEATFALPIRTNGNHVALNGSIFSMELDTYRTQDQRDSIVPTSRGQVPDPSWEKLFPSFG